MSVVIEALNTFDWQRKQVLVACSGGVDSMVLLHALAVMGVKPAVLHVNYGLRGEDSNGDEALVVKTAAQLGLECSVRHCPVEQTKAKGLNLQAAAREFRRDLFIDWTKKSPDHVVVLAHHLDDQLETFFLQYMRGSGLFGLGGMHPEKKQLRRPFLDIPKAAIVAFAQKQGIEWREDVSNTSNVYVRNRLRNGIIPALKQNHPDLAEHAKILMAALRDLQQEMLESVAGLAEVWKKEGKIVIHEWKKLTIEQQLAFAHSVNWPFWALKRVALLADEPDGNRAVIGNNVIIREQNAFVQSNRNTQDQRWDLKIEKVGFLPKKWDKHVLYLDAEKICGSLELRRWCVGDRIKSLGVEGTQLVSDILKDAKVPLSKRQYQHVLTDDQEILWVPGIKIGRTALATDASKIIWKITLE